MNRYRYLWAELTSKDDPNEEDRIPLYFNVDDPDEPMIDWDEYQCEELDLLSMTWFCKPELAATFHDGDQFLIGIEEPKPFATHEEEEAAEHAEYRAKQEGTWTPPPQQVIGWYRKVAGEDGEPCST